MTDNEIIKVLECYRGQKLFAFNGKRPEIYIHDIIDLITRQKAEIERVQSTVDSFTDIGKMYSEVKAEAYKEFAKRLKERAETEIYEDYEPSGKPICYKYQMVDVDEIDTLLKEMGGEDK